MIKIAMTGTSGSMGSEALRQTLELNTAERVRILLTPKKKNDKLAAKLKDLKAELFNLRFQLAINQLDNPMRINAVKKDIARVKTIIRENELKDSANA